MPLASLYIGRGRGDDVKQQRIENITKVTKDTFGPLKQPVWVVINEVSLNPWGMDGVLVKPAGAAAVE